MGVAEACPEVPSVVTSPSGLDRRLPEPAGSLDVLTDWLELKL